MIQFCMHDNMTECDTRRTLVCNCLRRTLTHECCFTWRRAAIAPSMASCASRSMSTAASRGAASALPASAGVVASLAAGRSVVAPSEAPPAKHGQIFDESSLFSSRAHCVRVSIIVPAVRMQPRSITKHSIRLRQGLHLQNRLYVLKANTAAITRKDVQAGGHL